jgi:hypothetical protein
MYKLLDWFTRTTGNTKKNHRHNTGRWIYNTGRWIYNTCTLLAYTGQLENLYFAFGTKHESPSKGAVYTAVCHMDHKEKKNLTSACQSGQLRQCLWSRLKRKVTCRPRRRGMKQRGRGATWGARIRYGCDWIVGSIATTWSSVKIYASSLLKQVALFVPCF